MDPIKIGKFISEMRKKNGMTQSDLASKLNVTNQAISKWENGRGIPDVEMLKSLSEVFNVNIDELLDGKAKEQKKNNKKILFGFLFLLLIVVGVGIIIFLNRDKPFQFASLATDNDAFTIKGVMAYNKNQKSIYISEVHYDLEDEEEYKNIECILYESHDYGEKLIDKIGNIEKSGDKTYYLTELLKGIEFNIQNYDCGCEALSCNNLYLRINALNKNKKVITYQIPIQLDTTCEG